VQKDSEKEIVTAWKPSQGKTNLKRINKWGALKRGEGKKEN
jgi:hypothetical protein